MHVKALITRVNAMQTEETIVTHAIHTRLETQKCATHTQFETQTQALQNQEQGFQVQQFL